jgi:hypothetical protein
MFLSMPRVVDAGVLCMIEMMVVSNSVFGPLRSYARMCEGVRGRQRHVAPR